MKRTRIPFSQEQVDYLAGLLASEVVGMQEALNKVDDKYRTEDSVKWLEAKLSQARGLRELFLSAPMEEVTVPSNKEDMT